MAGVSFLECGTKFSNLIYASGVPARALDSWF